MPILAPQAQKTLATSRLREVLEVSIDAPQAKENPINQENLTIDPPVSPSVAPPLHRARPTPPAPVNPTLTQSTLLERYARTLPSFIFGLFFYLVFWLLIHNIPPRLLANWLWADSYLLVQLLLLAGNFFVVTYLVQNRRVGAWFALTVASVLFFRFAHFVFTPPLIFSFVLLAAILWWLIVAKKPLAKS